MEVGNVIVVYDDELFPADLMCLYSELADNVCFIKTTNLDGETNLKIRKPLDLKGLPVGAGRFMLLSAVPANAALDCAWLLRSGAAVNKSHAPSPHTCLSAPAPTAVPAGE